MAPKIISSPDTSGAAPANCAWHACYEGHEEIGPYGFGRTENDAVSDLLNNYDEPTTK